MTDVRILGAGVAGLTIASALTARGINTVVTDPAGPPGPHGCSWWAGGMLAPYCERESAEESVLHHGRTAADWWSNHTTVTRNGSLVLALGRDQADLTRFARRTSGLQDIDDDRIAALEPDLAGRFRRALFFADEAHLNPRDALSALATKTKFSDEPAPLTPATITIDCRGLSARDHLADLRGVKGEMLVLKCPDITLNRPIRLLHPRIPLYIVPRGDGIYMLGATMIEATERTRITARSMLEMLTAAYALHPAFGEAEVLEIGVDARPAFPDNLPRLRKRGDTIYANGLYRHGFLLAPALAEMAADMVQTGAKPEFCDEYSV
jgi:glycine oxidase